MGAVIRCPIILAANKKIAELQTFKYNLNSNDESQVTVEGYLGHSDGQMLTGITAGCIVPVKGLSVDLIGKMLRKETISIGVPIEGKYHAIDMRITKADYDGDAKSGKLVGNFDFEGGAPKVAG